MNKHAEPALLGGPKVRDKPYPSYNPIGEEEIKRAHAVLETGMLSGFVGRGNDQFYGGPAVRELEQTFCERISVKHAVSMNSATSALHAAVVAAGIGPGDEVLVPPYTMSASATAIALAGATPVFVDIEADTFCIEPAKAEAALTPNTRGIMTVNLFGMASDLSTLRNLCDEKKLTLIEDNAQAPAAQFGNHFTGTLGDIGVFSLNRHKTMQVGEGGVAVTNDPHLAERLHLIRNHGEAVIADTGQTEHDDIIGCNYRLTEMQAAMAVPQLNRLDELNGHRIEMAEKLNVRLSTIEFLKTPAIRANCSHVYYLYPMLYDEGQLGISRDTFVAAMKAEGVHASNYTYPVHLMPLFIKDNRNHGSCPVTEDIEFNRIVVTNICRPPLGDSEIDEFVHAVEKITVAAPALLQWQNSQDS